MTGEETIWIDGEKLNTCEVVSVARGDRPVRISPSARDKVIASRRTLQAVLEDPQSSVYGVNTGFGRLLNERISEAQSQQLQENLILSHSAGVGEPFDRETVRAAMILRANSLAKGHSGVRPTIVDTLLSMLNSRVHPIVPSRGSLGASGDLAPLAHIAAVMLGKGEAEYGGETLPGAEAMSRAGIETVELQAKEGLALINGTQVSCGLVCLAAYDAAHLVKVSDLVGALTFFMLNGNVEEFSESIQSARPHKGQAVSAFNLRRILSGEKGVPKDSVQDAYSLRCMPQVHGAARQALDHVLSVLQVEMNAATDNPLVFPEQGVVLSGGNFHGEPLALVADYLKLAMAEQGSISERRTNRLLNPDLNGGLPAFLVDDPGLNSGYMLAQYTAASLVAENKVLAHPSSVDSIPVSADQEDHVSMSMNAAMHLRRVLSNLGYVLGVELLCACQAGEYVKRSFPKAVDKAYTLVRTRIPAMKGDVEVHPRIQVARDLVWGKELVECVVDVVGELE